MNNKTRSAVIGLFVLCAFAVIGGILLFLKPSFGDGALIFRVRFVNIEKIGVGTRVTLAGKPIGQVVRIRPVDDARLDDSPTSTVYSYELDLQIDSKTPIYHSDLFISQTSGLLGERSVAIIPQKVKKPLQQIQQGDLVYAHVAPSVEDTVERFGRLAYRTEQTLNAISDLVETGTPNVQTAIENLSVSSGLLRDILQSCKDENLAPSLAHAAKNTSLAMHQIHTWLEGLSEKGSIEDIREILSHTHRILAAFDQPERLSDILYQAQSAASQFSHLGIQANQAWPKLEKAIDQLAESGEQIASIGANGRAAMEQFHQVATHVYNGQGSLGRLLMKDDLYLDLSQTMARVNIILSDINNYGLFFQNNRTWKLHRAYQMDKLMSLREPAAFEKFWKDQLYGVHNQLGQLSIMLEQAQKQPKTADLSTDPNFQQALKSVLHQLSDLKEQLLLFESKLREPKPNQEKSWMPTHTKSGTHSADSGALHEQ